MRRLTMLLTGGMLWLGAIAFGQAPPVTNNQSAATARCRFDKDGDGKCDRCGRPAGQGRGQGWGQGYGRGRGQGQGRMMGMRRGWMAGGQGWCRGAGPGAAAQPGPAASPTTK